MTRMVVDASVIAKPFSPTPERFLEAANLLLDRVATAEIQLVAPELLHLEILDVAGRKWRLAEAALAVLADALEDMSISTPRVELERVVAWTSRGLSAYDAAYVAIAESEDIPFLTDDDQLVTIAGSIAQPLAAFA